MSSSTSPASTPSFDLTHGTSIPELRRFTLPSSLSSLSRLLSANHASHHCFFNTRGMHNHSIHQLIADLTLSATPDQLDAHYEYQIQHYLGGFSLNDRAKYDPYVSSGVAADRGHEIVKIDEGNWTNHLGNARYYWSYLHFFDAQLSSLGFAEVLEKYVLSREANQDGAQMIARFFGGVLHALIHYGYALELKLEGVAGEALAMAAATSAGHGWLFDYQWLFSSAEAGGEKEGGKGLLELVRAMQQDERLSVDSLKLRDEEASLPDRPFERGTGKGIVQAYVDAWDGDVEAVVGELAVFSGLLLGSVPKQPDGVAYRHDFFLMHLNNAHLFTPLLLATLPASLHLPFLRALISQFFYYYICRGRPSLTPTNFVAQHRVLDWAEMFAEARANVDEHLPKAVRALYVYEQRHSNLQAKLVESGLFDEGWKADESVWKMTADQLVRMHKGELQESKWQGKEAREKGEETGAHQEFWSFRPWF